MALCRYTRSPSKIRSIVESMISSDESQKWKSALRTATRPLNFGNCHESLSSDEMTKWPSRRPVLMSMGSSTMRSMRGACRLWPPTTIFMLGKTGPKVAMSLRTTLSASMCTSSLPPDGSSSVASGEPMAA